MDTTRVAYKNFIVDIKPNDLADATQVLGNMPPEEKDVFMKSVNRALDNVTDLISKNQQLTPKQIQDAMNDVCLWFANEVIEGRSEQYKVMVS